MIARGVRLDLIAVVELIILIFLISTNTIDLCHYTLSIFCEELSIMLSEMAIS